VTGPLSRFMVWVDADRHPPDHRRGETVAEQLAGGTVVREQGNGDAWVRAEEPVKAEQ